MPADCPGSSDRSMMCRSRKECRTNRCADCRTANTSSSHPDCSDRPAFLPHVGSRTFFGRPFASNPSSQFTLVNGLPERNCPFARSSTYNMPLRFAKSMTLRALPCQGYVRENRNLRGIEIEFVVGRELIMPLQLPCIGIERHHGLRIKVVARTSVSIPIGTGIADAPIRQIQIRDRKNRWSRSSRRRFSTHRPSRFRCRDRPVTG